MWRILLSDRNSRWLFAVSIGMEALAGYDEAECDVVRTKGVRLIS